jgi:cyclopropane fatty-acyl-phospholipid synthase-like methyltransferase
MASGGVRFDEAYYDKFYVDPATRVSDEAQHHRLVAGVVSMVEYFGQELERVLDIGAGVGRWGRWIAAHRSGVEVVSTELEASICARYGHEQRDISRWRSRKKFDLVVCQGVLPYLDDDAASAAIENIAAMSRGFLYLEAITKRDVREVVDTSVTDLRIHARPGSFYRARLRAHFREVGAGLWYVRDGDLSFYELEARP